MSGPITLGTCDFFLYAVDVIPVRAEYTINVRENNLTDEFIFTRLFPLFLEHNIGKIEFAFAQNLLEELIRITDNYEKGKEIETQESHVDGENLVSKFSVDLMLSNRMYVINNPWF